MPVTKKPPRKNPSARVIAQLNELYGRECVVCGKDALFVELAHTDDQRHQSILGNLLPLCFNANHGSQRATYPSTPPLSDEVEPNNLINAGHAKFRKGRYAQAYGCYRLASHLFGRNISRAVECLNFSIAAIRPLGHRGLLRYTILYETDLIDRFLKDVIPYWKADFLNQIALVLVDYGRWQDAAEFGFLAEQLLTTSSLESVYPEEQELKMAAQKRRIAHVTGGRQQVTSLLRDAKAHQEKHHDITGLATTLHVETILELNSKGITVKAIDLVEQALALQEKITNKWPLAELHFLRGFFETQQKGRRNRKRAVRHLKMSLDLFVDNKIAREPLRIQGALVHIDPCTLLEQLGLRPDRKLHIRYYPPLTDSDLRYIKKSVLG